MTGSRRIRRTVLATALLAVLPGALPGVRAAAAAEGQATWAVHITLAPTWFDPAETPGIVTPFMVLYALHDGLVKPTPGIRFTLKQPWPDFMAFYATPATGSAWIVPKKYVEQVGPDGFKKAPVGAGPYKFVSFKPGVELVLEAHEQYWRKPPAIKTLVFRGTGSARGWRCAAWDWSPTTPTPRPTRT